MSLSGEDYFEIQNVINAYMLHMDAGDGDAFANLFTEDGECEIVILQKTFKGRDELKQLCNDIHSRFPTASHWEGNVVIGGCGSVARNDSYWQAIDNGCIISTGKHQDLLSKQNSTWLIKKRTITHTWRKPSA